MGSIDGKQLKLDTLPNSRLDLRVATLNFSIDAFTNVITTGSKGVVVIPFPCNLVKVRLLSRPSETGSIVMDVRKADFANYPNLVSIVGDVAPEISSSNKYEDDVLTNWDTIINADDQLEFVVDSVTDFTQVTVSLFLEKV